MLVSIFNVDVIVLCVLLLEGWVHGGARVLGRAAEQAAAAVLHRLGPVQFGYHVSGVTWMGEDIIGLSV